MICRMLLIYEHHKKEADVDIQKFLESELKVFGW